MNRSLSVELMVSSSFGRHAATYEASATIQAWLADWLSEWLEPVWPDRCDVIEAGAGTGLFTRRLVRRGRVVAMDLSAAMVREGSSRVAGAVWRTGDACRLQVDCCDRLYSSAMLQWADDPWETMRVWRDALRPGGRMLHGLFVTPTLPELASLDPDAVPLMWREAETWCEAMEEAGLRVLRLETRQVAVRYTDALGFLRSLHDTGVTPAKPRLGPGRLRELLRSYGERHRSEDGGVRATWTALRIEAERVA